MNFKDKNEYKMCDQSYQMFLKKQNVSELIDYKKP